MARLWREYSYFMCTQAHPSHAFDTYFMCDIVCAKKKASFGLGLTIWLSFKIRKICSRNSSTNIVNMHLPL